MRTRCRWITENDGLLEKVGTNLLSFTPQNRNFRIDYDLTEFIIIYLSINSTFRAPFHCVLAKENVDSFLPFVSKCPF
jgi:hypothetical protein